MANEQRLDAYLVSHGLATGRDKACERIRGGDVAVNGKTVTKPSYRVSENDTVSCADTADDFVGRGGLKLEHILSQVAPLSAGFTAMDVGASTGGFTDCLLRHGASHVYAVDVGHGQLHPSLCADARVSDLSGVDIRRREQVAEHVTSVDVLTMDVSFISLKQALPSVFEFLKPDARLFVLIKPQFEAGRADIGKNGIVRDRRVHYRVLREITEFFTEQGCTVERLSASPITGGAGRQHGNIEYIAALRRTNGAAFTADIRALVDEAFKEVSL